MKQTLQNIPDQVIELLPNKKVTWIYDKGKINYQLKGFSLNDKKNKEYIFLAEEIVLIKLKEIFAQKIFQARFQDEYEVLSEIGKGNYARVIKIKTQKKTTGEIFAVKCFEKYKLQNIENGILSLYNELKIMRSLRQHENIIKFYEIFEGANTIYLVMEIVQGISLLDEINNHAYTPFKDAEIQDLMKQLISGVQSCSQKGIMHRDLKPENILLQKKGDKTNLKIVDFGLATFQDENPYIFPKCGTPGFVAPEIANLNDKSLGYSTICDMFSVGVIFHILLVGETVFPGNKFNDVLKKNKEANIDFTRKIYENISLPAKNLLKQILQKEPMQRITPQQALENIYFKQNQFKKAPSFDLAQKDFYEIENIQKNEENIRSKQVSMFIGPVRIPNIIKERSNENSVSFRNFNKCKQNQEQIKQNLK
ncbi:protein kinase domain protein [Ichthyophthirius multifiliis]|uniref:Protein kinase domain protein n=1 Tax=Ichthyophthirius multifiliis TaxID=5932 RepID=G0QMY2_ICHMU|nr:protein kinase domain protein [Ichthyophthirius multifiliis]EGR33427.1 protein kinase domain protein [Ichthyophthirius multifiliis]|eukprot:XP_004037413.1 protein kinase domain protein [Ichthyophthirius multifiliis]